LKRLINTWASRTPGAWAKLAVLVLIGVPGLLLAGACLLAGFIMVGIEVFGGEPTIAAALLAWLLLGAFGVAGFVRWARNDMTILRRGQLLELFLLLGCGVLGTTPLMLFLDVDSQGSTGEQVMLVAFAIGVLTALVIMARVACAFRLAPR
jgi:hypothetical protein